MKYSYETFRQEYPTDDIILTKIFEMRFGGTKITCPKCNKITTYHKLKKRQAFSCSRCRNQIYPTKGTVFEKHHLPISKWFYALQILTGTLYNDISGKELSKALGCKSTMGVKIKKKIYQFIKETSKEND